MPGQRGSENRQKSEQVLVRMAPELARRVNAVAEAAGLSSASWIRDLAVKELGVDRKFVAPTPRVAVPPRDLLEISRLTASVARLNGAVVQLQISIREAGTMDLHAEGERVLADLRSIQPGLVDATLMVKNAVRSN
ncbi:hypothetical protein [Roseibium alexandrii]|uniref:Uncharacterized protein n=1 Tax=Roseibium alexandrii TaxID=388408 RepID=A0A0M7AR06_9HYPH|nr:hypothetical protein [Roseibium alexandrii]CTQ77575.1 hypothetical protein LAX5112_04959 [Roseibium alexandrii]